MIPQFWKITLFHAHTHTQKCLEEIHQNINNGFFSPNDTIMGDFIFFGNFCVTFCNNKTLFLRGTAASILKYAFLFIFYPNKCYEKIQHTWIAER